MKKKLDLPKNLILYGPPGVGKTYRISQLRKHFESSKDSTSTLSAWIQDLAWWEVAAVAINDLGKDLEVSQLITHPFIRAKAAQSNNNNIRATLWGNMQMHTDPTNPNVKVTNRAEPFVFSKNSNSQWSLTADSTEYIAELIARKKEATDSTLPAKRYEFVTFHQSLSYEDFVEGIRPILHEGGGIGYELHKGAFKRICELAILDSENDYAIFIDEINRGNISKIFGELITLIELDKRLTGSPSDLTVSMPYSKTQFGVPANLFIIGTMNSADRSIAIMDTALRRRFEFEELRPLLTRIPESISGINLRLIVEKMNKIISKNLSPDFELGHAYFEADRCAGVNNLIAIWNHQILPLMKEYFWDNPVQLKAIIGPFVEVEGDNEHGAVASRIVYEYDEEEFITKMSFLVQHFGIA